MKKNTLNSGYDFVEDMGRWITQENTYNGSLETTDYSI